jgi:hypothetical protein
MEPKQNGQTTAPTKHHSVKTRTAEDIAAHKLELLSKLPKDHKAHYKFAFAKTFQVFPSKKLSPPPEFG